MLLSVSQWTKRLRLHTYSEVEEPGGDAVARFVLTFWPRSVTYLLHIVPELIVPYRSWSIWDEARKYSNSSGTDDVRPEQVIIT